MLIQLNAEVWMGILNWLLKYRKEMAEKFAQFGDVEFSQITQTWLHEWTRNVELGHLGINVEGLENDFGFDLSELEIISRDQLAILNRTEMPAKITDFSAIIIRHLDAEALQFLGQIQRLLSGVNLCIAFNGLFLPEPTKITIRQLLLRLNGIEALGLCAPNFELVVFFLASSLLQLYEARILDIALPKQVEYQDSVLRWLLTPREDGRPRTLLIDYCEENAIEFVGKIRKANW